MKTAKKLLALFLSVLMVFTMVSSSVVAVAEKTQIEDIETSVDNTFDSIRGIIDGVHNLVGGIMSMLGKECVFCDEIHGEDADTDTQEPAEPEASPSEPEEPEEPVEPEVPSEPDTEEPEEETKEDELDNVFDSVGGLFDAIHSLVGGILAIFDKECPFCDQVHGEDEGETEEPEEPDAPEEPEEPDDPETPEEPVEPEVPEETTYTVSFDLNYEGAENNIPSQSVKEGETVVEPAEPIRDGFTFITWYSDSACLNRFDFSREIETNYVLYALWAEGEKEIITREEWIVALSKVMNININEYLFYSFDDNSETSNAAIIETAYSYGWFSLSPDEDNMVYFNPTEAATREFVALTATNALTYDTSALELPAWNDVSEAEYPLNDLQAVNSEILFIENNNFKPQEAIRYVDMQIALHAVMAILKHSEIDEDAEGYVDYVEGIKQTELFYSIDEDDKKIYTINGDKVKDWAAGEVHILISGDSSENDVAIKVIRIYEENGYTVIEYEEPDIGEVVEGFDVEGVATTGAMFTPAEGISVKDQQQTTRMLRMARATVDDTVPLWGPLTLEIDELDTEITFDLQNIEYRFVASPSWHLISIDEVYVAINAKISADWQLEDLEFEPDGILLGNIDCPIGYGFNISGEIYLTFEAEAGLNIVFSISSKTGVQYTKNTGVRFIKDIIPNLTPIKVAGSVEAGVEIEPGAEFLGIDLVSVGVGIGWALDGEFTPFSLIPWEKYCFDATSYIYLNIYAQIGPDDAGLKFTKDIYNADNSFYVRNFHFEETGKKEECTRGNGNYKGSVMRADDDRIPVSNAKIQVYRGSTLKDTTITDSHGNFVGISLPSGSYRIRISCSGYLPYERNFDIVGGQTTTIATQLIISRDSEGEDGWDSRSCSGYVTNAYTGGRVSGATVEIRTQHLVGNNDLIDVVTTDANGYFSFTTTIGQYEIKVIKEGYITNAISVTLFNDIVGANVVLNPESAVVLDGNLRTVLTWGYYPRDLDSHMIGPEGTGKFHVAYYDMNSSYVSLDVDDTSGEGPETITITQTENGTYSYYVHDYSNRHSGSSAAMSNSGAKVELYNGNNLMYTINIPTNQGGTVWHVFDYDSETGLITLINEFSYESNPEYVG